ncbi:MAG: hypothetical protein ACFFHV_09175 [Promethearchaeota archaeon]
MTDLHITIPNKGLPIGSKAPLIETTDIDDNEVNLAIMLKNHRGVLIDFFRGGW